MNEYIQNIHPKSIEKKHEDLCRLVEKYPDNIPIEEASDFLGIDRTKLRELVQTGNFCAGYGMKGGTLYNGYSRVNTFAFYNFCTNNAFFRQGTESGRTLNV